MIKNQKQYGITKAKLVELKSAKDEFESKTNDRGSFEYKLGINSFNGLIQDLEQQIGTYESLIHGNLHCLKAESLEELSNVLIAGRIAQKISQKDLGEFMGIQEQQIQRYEATDYESASWHRIVEAASALNMKFYFEKIIIINSSDDDSEFEYPNNITAEIAEEATRKIQARGLTSFILN